MTESSPIPQIPQIPSTWGPPIPELSYPTLPLARQALTDHGNANFYRVSIRDTQPRKDNPQRIVYVCDRSGKYDKRGKKTDVPGVKPRPNTSSRKCGCEFKVIIKKEGSGWRIQVVEGRHNHPPSDLRLKKQQQKDARLLRKAGSLGGQPMSENGGSDSQMSLDGMNSQAEQSGQALLASNATTYLQSVEGSSQDQSQPSPAPGMQAQGQSPAILPPQRRNMDPRLQKTAMDAVRAVAMEVAMKVAREVALKVAKEISTNVSMDVATRIAREVATSVVRHSGSRAEDAHYEVNYSHHPY
jgi:hypothetical protein